MEFDLSVSVGHWTKVGMRARDMIVMPNRLNREWISKEQSIQVFVGYPDRRAQDNTQNDTRMESANKRASTRNMMLPIPASHAATGLIFPQLDAPLSLDTR